MAVFDAPHELPDEPIVQRLQDRFQCTVVNTRRNKHQGTDIPNSIRTYSVIMRKDLPATMCFGRFVIRFHYSGAKRRCNKCSQEGYVARDCPETCVLTVIILAMKADNVLAREDAVFVNLLII